jgi:hypothetical protein
MAKEVMLKKEQAHFEALWLKNATANDLRLSFKL